MEKKRLKHDPCPECGGKRKSKDKRRLICADCGRTSLKPTPASIMPDGHCIKGISTLVDSDGKTKIQWIKTQQLKAEKDRLLKEALLEIKNTIPAKKPVTVEKALSFSNHVMSVYPVVDAHLGMLSWGKETGESFDIDIAEKRLIRAISHLCYQGISTRKALVCFLGDFFHSDNQAGVTPASGNKLDTDGRWAKVLRLGVRSAVNIIDMTLMSHRKVGVIVSIGNHDEHSSIFLSTALDAHYRNEPRVKIDLSPTKFHYHKFGNNLIGLTHGDTVKLGDLESIMSSDVPYEWGSTKHRYWYTAHTHHVEKKEYRGCMVEVFRTLAAKDSWHARHGYRSGQDMVKIQLHEEHGEVVRSTCNVSIL